MYLLQDSSVGLTVVVKRLNFDGAPHRFLTFHMPLIIWICFSFLTSRRIKTWPLYYLVNTPYHNEVSNSCNLYDVRSFRPSKFLYFCGRGIKG